MRVVHLHRILGIGGSERHLLTLLPALAERGLDVAFVGLDGGPPAEPFYRELAVPYERLSCTRDLAPRLAGDVARTLRRLRPDLVHTHLVHADVYGAFGASRAGAALVSTKHNDDRFRAGAFRFAERGLTRRAGRVIAITEALRRFCVDVVGLPAQKVEVVHYGLDELPEPWAAPGRLAVPEDARVLLAITRLVEQKGVDVAVRALAQVRERHPGAVLLVLGDGKGRQELVRLARELGVAEAVHLPGRVPDVGTWLRRAEVLVHPVRWEGFGLAVLEAMLAGKPVVASAVGSLRELVVDGATGVLVPRDDPRALAAAVTRLLDDPPLAASLGAAGRERAADEFSVARMAERTISVYASASAAR